MRQRLFDQCRWVKNASASSLLRSNEYRWEHNCTVSGIPGTSLSASHLGIVLFLLGATFSQESVIGRRRVIAPESASTGPKSSCFGRHSGGSFDRLNQKNPKTAPQPASLNPHHPPTRSLFIAAARDTRHLRWKKSSHPPGDRKPPVRRLVSDPAAAGYPPVLRACSHCCLTVCPWRDSSDKLFAGRRCSVATKHYGWFRRCDLGQEYPRFVYIFPPRKICHLFTIALADLFVRAKWRIILFATTMFLKLGLTIVYLEDRNENLVVQS